MVDFFKVQAFYVGCLLFQKPLSFLLPLELGDILRVFQGIIEQWECSGCRRGSCSCSGRQSIF